jgi:hypothetical protein
MRVIVGETTSGARLGRHSESPKSPEEAVRGKCHRQPRLRVDRVPKAGEDGNNTNTLKPV